MLVPFSWLKDYVDVNVSAEQLKEKLFSCGFEVEELTYLGKDVLNVAVGEILTCEKHPDADRLTVCRVDCGAHGVKTIVTAATNVFAGAKVPVALDGATVKHEGGVEQIRTGKLRGVTSEGMFCSGEELGINDDFYEGAEVNGILILDRETPNGADIRPIVGIDDWIFDIAVTANRPDCQSIAGIAREAAAVLKLPFKMPDLTYHAKKTDVKIPVEVRDEALCPRYMGQYVADVKVGVSPRWLRRRLALCGLRSISNVVDITNYVLLEMGQPMHAFDCNFLRGKKIIVRRAENGEKITTLDKKEFTLTRENLLICDGEGGVALAGIMGGLNSEIVADTTQVFLEAAKFARDSVRKTSRALGQRSDSSARFEKGVDCNTPALALDRALHLIETLKCGTPTAYRADTLRGALVQKRVEARYAQLNALLGIRVPKKEVNAILTRLGFTVTDEGKKFTVAVPLWREDVDGYPDLAEEVIRMYGYDRITSTFLKNATVTHGGYTEAQKAELALKDALTDEGYSEALNYSFYSPKSFRLFRLSDGAPERNAVKIMNPISEDLSVMRTFLAPSMLENIVRNVRRGNYEGRLFEIASVYLADELPLKRLPREEKRLVLGQWGEGDFFELKGAIEDVAERFGVRLSFAAQAKPFLHPGKSAVIACKEEEVGWIGELHPSIAEELALERAPLLAELNASLFQERRQIVCTPLPAFPDVQRDIAFVVKEEITCAEATGCIRRACKAVKRAELFDVYRGLQVGEGKKSLAFRLTFSQDAAADKPLAPETVDGYFKKILSSLTHVLGAELR